jgi:hypothetical protein
MIINDGRKASEEKERIVPQVLGEGKRGSREKNENINPSNTHLLLPPIVELIEDWIGLCRGDICKVANDDTE